MTIGFLIRTGGIFGSVREVIENGNVLTDLGHDVTIYTDHGKDLGWLPNNCQWESNEKIKPLDCLIFIDDPDEKYYELFKRAEAKVKAYCMLGFDKSRINGQFVSPVHHELITNYWPLADSDWQLEIIRYFNPDCGPSIGGINTTQFKPVVRKKIFDVSWSNDPRPRKDSKTVATAIGKISNKSYYRKGIKQDDLKKFLCDSKVFVDGHIRGGWCNPVAEAMACGVPVVCTETPCNSSFAIDDFTCIRVKEGDSVGMRAGILKILSNEQYAKYLSGNALDLIRKFDYRIVGKRLSEAIIQRVNAATN